MALFGESIRVTQVSQIFPKAAKSGMLFFTCEIINVCLYFSEHLKMCFWLNIMIAFLLGCVKFFRYAS